MKITVESLFWKNKRGVCRLITWARKGWLHKIPCAHLDSDTLRTADCWGNSVVHFSVFNREFEYLAKSITADHLFLKNQEGITPLHLLTWRAKLHLVNPHLIEGRYTDAKKIIRSVLKDAEKPRSRYIWPGMLGGAKQFLVAVAKKELNRSLSDP